MTPKGPRAYGFPAILRIHSFATGNERQDYKNCEIMLGKGLTRFTDALLEAVRVGASVRCAQAVLPLPPHLLCFQSFARRRTEGFHLPLQAGGANGSAQASFAAWTGNQNGDFHGLPVRASQISTLKSIVTMMMKRKSRLNRRTQLRFPVEDIISSIIS